MYGQQIPIWINRVWLPILFVIGWAEIMNISPSLFAPENLVSRDKFGRPTLSFSELRLNIMLTRGTPPRFARRRQHNIPPTAIGSVPSLLGHAVCVPMGLTAKSPPAKIQ
ncbi:unnamed protein product [Ascophyllum nodosum]